MVRLCRGTMPVCHSRPERESKHLGAHGCAPSPPELGGAVVTKRCSPPKADCTQPTMRQVEAMLTAHTYDRLPKIKAPILVIGGTAEVVLVPP